MSKEQAAETTPPPGFKVYGPSAGFAVQVGPFYARLDDDGDITYGFATAERHANLNGVVHGGALYTFADQLLGHAVVYRLKRMCATTKLKVEYLAPVHPGRWVEGRCEIVGSDGDMAFVRARLTTGRHLLMTADGCFRLLAPWQPGTPVPGAERPTPTQPPPAPPEGFKAFRIQSPFVRTYAPTFYRRDPDGTYVCGMQCDAGFDNSNGIVHGGALYTFADEVIGRAGSATSRRYSATITLDASYLAAAPLDAWLEGRASVVRQTNTLSFLRTEVSGSGRLLLTADAILRLFDRYDRPTA